MKYESLKKRVMGFFVCGIIIVVFLYLGIGDVVKQALWKGFTNMMYGLYLPRACALQESVGETISQTKEQTVRVQMLRMAKELLEDEDTYPEECCLEEEGVEEKEELPVEESFLEIPQPLNLFVPGDKVAEVSFETLGEYEELVKEYFTIDSTTTAGAGLLNINTFQAKDNTLQKDASAPQILIYHTHSREGYADSSPEDMYTGVVGVGEKLATILRETYGYNVLHHVEVFDKPDFTKAYSNALPVISSILEENPSIQVVIDLHRDDLPETFEYSKQIQGLSCARFMFFNGLSRTKGTGPLDYLKNENLEGNLAFSFALQTKAKEYYPDLARKIYLKGYRYNMHLKEKSLLLELGCQHNTYEEACNSCYPLAHILDLVLSGQ